MKKINIIFCIVAAFILIGCGEYKIKSNSPDTSRELKSQNSIDELEKIVTDNYINDVTYWEEQLDKYKNYGISIHTLIINIGVRQKEILKRNEIINEKIRSIKDKEKRNELASLNADIIILYETSMSKFKTINLN